MRRWLILACLIALSAPARAESKQWEAGVSQADQERANALFAEANRLYGQQAYAPAVDKYRAALAIWNHPVIRFNLGVTLFKLDRFVEAGEALEAALAFGNAPFSKEQLDQIAEYQTKLRDHIGEISASCADQETKVSLDGKDWFTCPGARTIRVLAGEHAIVAETAAQHVTVGAGTKVSTLIKVGALERAERRWSPWVPWTIVLSGAGVAIGSTGVALWAKSKYSIYAHDGMAKTGQDDGGVYCSPGGCSIVESTRAANHYNDVARFATYPFIIGAGAMITGTVMLLVNRKVTRVPAVEVVPTGDGAAASASWQF